MPLRPLILLFHADAGIESTLEQIFQSRTWTHIDMATMTIGNLKNLRSIEKTVLNVYIRYKSGVHQSFLNNIYANSRCMRLKVVVHFNVFVHESLTPMCLCNADWILVKKSDMGGFSVSKSCARLFEATGISLEQAETSTCDLVGIKINYTSYCTEFVEVRDEYEPASRDRIKSRCTTIAEELMQVTWHPDRLRRITTLSTTDGDCFVDNM